VVSEVLRWIWKEYGVFLLVARQQKSLAIITRSQTLGRHASTFVREFCSASEQMSSRIPSQWRSLSSGLLDGSQIDGQNLFQTQSHGFASVMYGPCGILRHKTMLPGYSPQSALFFLLCADLHEAFPSDYNLRSATTCKAITSLSNIIAAIAVGALRKRKIR
jgi:hypothetical protein